MMSRLILFTILIATFASIPFEKTASGQDQFQPAFARTLEQAIDPSFLSAEKPLAVPERVKPKRLPAAQVKSIHRLPSIQVAEQFYAPSISSSNVYRAPTRPSESAVDHPERFAHAPTPLLPVQLPIHAEPKPVKPQVDPTWSTRPNTTRFSDMDVSLVELPADESKDGHLTIGSYLLSDQSIGQPKLPTDSEFGTVMMFRAGETTQQLSFPRAEDFVKSHVAPPKPTASKQPPLNHLAPVDGEQRGTTYNFASSPSTGTNPIGFIPTAASSIPKPSSSVSPTPTPPAKIQSHSVTATLGDTPPMDEPANTTQPLGFKALSTIVIGPENLAPNVPDVFEIVVTNESGVSATEVIIEFNVSEDVTITKLDRNAWLDDENRKVSWKVVEIPAGGKEIIRFNAVCETPGVFQQSIRLGVNNIFQGTTYFDTNVLEPSR